MPANLLQSASIPSSPNDGRPGINADPTPKPPSSRSRKRREKRRAARAALITGDKDNNIVSASDVVGGKSRPLITAAQAERRVAEDVKELWNGRDLVEARYYFATLDPEHRHLLVSKLASSALDRREDDVKLVAELFSSVAGELCTEKDFETGLSDIVETVDDLSVDVPKAYSYVARLLIGTRLPYTKVAELCNRITFDGIQSYLRDTVEYCMNDH